MHLQLHNYQEQITLEEVSDYVGLTPAYFSVMFKKETEIGFAKYLINERIEGAKDLLRESTLSVADICRKVGYNDPKHFTRLFEKNVGVKPAVYRKCGLIWFCSALYCACRFDISNVLVAVTILFI